MHVFVPPCAVADMESNSFKCQVVLTKKNNDDEGADSDPVLFSIPCSPAFFGKASMPSLKQNGGQQVRGSLRLPPPGNELGCKNVNDNIQDEEEGHSLQIVKRGSCNFMKKASNHRHKGGVIVLNSAPYELFVMAADKPVLESTSDDLPVSVLISGKDGESMLQFLEEERSKGSDIEASILLTKSEESTTYPYVKGTEEALQILASNGWGVHAVPQQQQAGWQLFITQHEHNKAAVH